ncbi:hypothetical protein [Spiroplasma citri]|uniref:Uncharacterized protein n=1 Tax=Spiroplasma citri TaxID=2133 RepID=A0AAJ4EJP2_SPICI|nr:hypothetical protein [Spiroplasma citri]QIA68958.1 hypothetical protein GL298_05215 [Spiroplasma citri]
MHQICEMCKKKDLQKYMTGFNDSFFCQKCEFKGMAEKVLKELEKTEKIKYNKDERKKHLGDLTKTFERQNKKMITDYQNFKNKSLDKKYLDEEVKKYLELYKESYKLATRAIALLNIISDLDDKETKEESIEFINTVNKYQDIKKEEFFLEQEIDFNFLSKTTI